MLTVGDVLTMGEVHTALLLRAGSLGPAGASGALDLVPGAAVRRSERPNRYAVSADQYTGVDCGLSTASGSRVRGVGTVAHRAVIAGGRVVQGSAYAVLERGTGNGRQPWSHYLARPGRVEFVGRADARQLADGFLDAPDNPEGLHLGAVSGRMVDAVQERAADGERRTIPLRGKRVRLRWVAVDSDDDPQVTFAVHGETARTIRVRGKGLSAAAIQDFCEDIALHDWLLTTLIRQLDAAQIGTAATAKVVAQLRPLADELLHLWMPGARADATAQRLWTSLEHRPGFSRQWLAGVHRVRDQLALGACAPPGQG